MTTYLPRSEWTSTSAGGATLTGAELVGVALHWPGTGQAAIGVETKAQVAARLRGYRSFHVVQRGWADIGYNIAIDQAGRVWLLRSTTFGVNRVGAHAASSGNPRANHKYAGVLLILGAQEAPSAAMIAAFADWYHRVFLGRWPGRTDLRGHGKVPGAATSCQGPIVQARIADGTFGRKPSSGGPTTGPTTGGAMSEQNVIDGLKKALESAAERGSPYGRQLSDAIRAIVVPSTASAVWREQLNHVGSDGKTAETTTSAGVHLRYGRHEAWRGAAVADQVAEQNVAILAAVQGLNEQEILDRIDQHHAQVLARFAAVDELIAGLTELAEEIAEGRTDAAAIVEALRELVHQATAPAES